MLGNMHSLHCIQNILHSGYQLRGPCHKHCVLSSSCVSPLQVPGQAGLPGALGGAGVREGARRPPQLRRAQPLPRLMPHIRSSGPFAALCSAALCSGALGCSRPRVWHTGVDLCCLAMIGPCFRCGFQLVGNFRQIGAASRMQTSSKLRSGVSPCKCPRPCAA